ncbi:MAG: hypothetical protein QOF18_114 [Frankiaceae bacterium]|nr:hypothetical protein [Frankiaceae bacterium]
MSLRALRRIIAPLLATALVSLSAGLVAVVVPTAAYAESSYSMESQFIAKMNSARQANGQAPYAVVSDLTSVARAHSQNMASKHSLYHNPSLTSDVHNWQAVGENVGEGASVDDIHTAFMNSPEHRSNILDHDFTQVGVGVTVDKSGTVWVTEDFRQPMGGSSSSSSSTTHHSTQPVHHSSPTPTTSSSSGASTSYGSPTTATGPVSSPRPSRSPRAVLLHRLHQLRHQQHGKSAADPVAQGFDYVATLSRLAS